MLIRGECDVIISEVKQIDSIIREILAAESLYDRLKEHIWIVCLDKNGKLLAVDLSALGCAVSVNTTLWSMVAIAHERKECTAIVIVHNHFYWRMPSPEDIQGCKRAMEMLRPLTIDLWDDVIILEHGGYFSFKENGILDNLEKGIIEGSVDLDNTRYLLGNLKNSVEDMHTRLNLIENSQRDLIKFLTEKDASVDPTAIARVARRLGLERGEEPR
jgi:hypothetical protein